MAAHPTPVLPFSSQDYKRFYEPSEDTFLLLDSLEADLQSLKAQQPLYCMEIGSGSGCVITFLASLLGRDRIYFAVDINDHAITATKKTSSKNNVSVECVQTDLLSGLRGLRGKLDVLIFNPPYVPSPPEEMGRRDLAAAWAGGKDGREVLDRLLPQLKHVLSPTGCFFVVTMRANKPEEICTTLAVDGFQHKVIMKRGAGMESLAIYKFWRQPTTH